MPATDSILATEQQLWTLLLAWPGFTSLVRPGNRIRFDDLAKLWADLIKRSKQVADAPELRIEPTGFQADSRPVRTLCAQKVVRNVTFAHTIIGSDRTINLIGQVRAEIEACYLAAGPQLGIPATVARVEFPGRYQLTPPDQKGGVSSRQVVLNVTVTVKG